MHPNIMLDNTEAALQEALLFCQTGRFVEAKVLYDDLIKRLPKHPQVLTNLGSIEIQFGNFEDGVKRIQRSLEIDPNQPKALSNCGNGLLKLNRLDEALRCCDNAIRLVPDFAEAHNNRGAALHARGQHEAAIENYERAIALKPDYVEAYANHAAALHARGQHEAAIENYERAIALNPNSAEAHANHAAALHAMGQHEAAIESYERAIALNPNSAEAHANRGAIFLAQSDLMVAEIAVRRALALNPQLAGAHMNLGAILSQLGRHAEAASSFRQALAIESDPRTYGVSLFNTNYHPDISAEEVYAKYQAFNQQLCLPLKKEWRPHTNSRVIKRRLKVGYVSADFKQHVVAMFLTPLLAHHNPEHVEVYAYAQVDVDEEDAMTSHLKSYVAHWVPTTALSDDALAQRIRDDGIDVLVDLAGHSAGNRLMVFARKPAPVSVSMLGYGYSTGLEAIDYYLTDAATAPFGSEHLFSETLWHLPCALVYRPIGSMGGEVNPLPAELNGYVTFGTLTRPIRINHRTVRVWSAILKALPNAKLVVNNHPFKFKTCQEQLEERFALHGILPHQLIIGFESPPWNVLRGMDITLDCFPHNSGTTLIDSLYTGVPFITLADRPSVGRIGSSILEAMHHPEWIAATEETYIQKAIALASDIPKLANIRVKLRREMQASLLMNAPAYAQSVEQAYQAMFKRWSEQSQ